MPDAAQTTSPRDSDAQQGPIAASDSDAGQPFDASLGGPSGGGLLGGFGGTFGGLLGGSSGGLLGGSSGLDVAVVPQPCDDDDGLLESVERDAGLDPCKTDSDGDGCDDAAELLLGGCDDPRNALAWNVCFQGYYAARVQFRAPVPDAGSWPKLTLVSVQSADVLIAAQPNPRNAPAASGASFLSVPYGSVLDFALEIPNTFEEGSSLLLKLTSEDGRVLGQGRVVVVGRECPLVI